MQTLPNIDINIKQGNSLLSRYKLDEDLSEVFQKQRFSLQTYRHAVQAYKDSKSKEAKAELLRFINEIKEQFKQTVSNRDPRRRTLSTLRGNRALLDLNADMFGNKKLTDDQLQTQKTKLDADIQKIETQMADVEQNRLYRGSFEWRFEFPEVLDDHGNFTGFDVVIGNPPYMRVQEIEKTQPNAKVYYEANYQNAKAAYDLANLFFELAVNISNQTANNSYIFPHKFFNAGSAEVFRDYLIAGKFIDKVAHFGANMVFDDADTYTCVAWFSKHQNDGFLFQQFPYKSDFHSLMLKNESYGLMTYDMIQRASALYGNNQWIMFNDPKGYDLFEKIYINSKTLEDSFEGIYQGLATSKDDLYILENGSFENNLLTATVPISNTSYQLEPDLFKPFLMGKDVQRYANLSTNKYVFFPYLIENNQPRIVPVAEIEENYPLTFIYLTEHEKQFKARESGKAGKMEHWHAYIYPKNLNKFEQPKLSSMEICANHPNVIFNYQNFYHSTTVYSWVKKETTKESYEYFLAVANSSLLWWFLKLTGDTLQGDARRFKTNYLNPFPIPAEVSEAQEIEITDKVNQILSLKKANATADTRTLEAEIDALVYALYGLSAEEIAVVEGRG